MTQAADTTVRSDDADITDVDDHELELPTPDEMRQARRRGLIEGVLQRNELVWDDRGEADISALAIADDEHLDEVALDLVCALTTDTERSKLVASDLIRELRAFEDDLRALASNAEEDLSPDARRELAAAALDAVAQLTATIGQLGGRASLRVAAIIAELAPTGLTLAEDGSIQRDTQIAGIKALVAASVDDEPRAAAALLQTITGDALGGVDIVDSIVLALRAVDGDPAALDQLRPDASPSSEPPPAPAASNESHELPVHRVTCMAPGCKAGATYRPTASGAGFMILERFGMDLETVLGAGPNGRPVCPHGHGEMTLADDQLPAKDAIAQVAERVEREKKPPRLPFPAPAFNYEAVFREIVDKRHEVADLERDYEKKKESASKAKKALDEGNEQLGQMIDDYEERAQEREFEIARRQRQADEGHPEGTTLVRCIWEQQHPDDACPLCSTSTTVHGRQAMVKLLGAEILPRDANGHADQVVEYRTRLDVRQTFNTLDGFLFGVPESTVAAWTPVDRAAVRGWFDTGGDSWETRPAAIGTPHRASAVADGARVQTCSVCGSVLKQLDSIDEAYPTHALVRTDCAGPEPEPHRYPDTSKKPARPRATTKQAKPAKPAKTGKKKGSK